MRKRKKILINCLSLTLTVRRKFSDILVGFDVYLANYRVRHCKKNPRKGNLNRETFTHVSNTFHRVYCVSCPGVFHFSTFEAPILAIPPFHGVIPSVLYRLAKWPSSFSRKELAESFPTVSDDNHQGDLYIGI